MNLKIESRVVSFVTAGEDIALGRMGEENWIGRLGSVEIAVKGASVLLRSEGSLTGFPSRKGRKGSFVDEGFLFAGPEIGETSAGNGLTSENGGRVSNLGKASERVVGKFGATESASSGGRTMGSFLRAGSLSEKLLRKALGSAVMVNF